MLYVHDATFFSIYISVSGLACLATFLVPSSWGHWPLVMLSTLGKFATSAAFAVIFLQVGSITNNHNAIRFFGENIMFINISG